MKMIFVLHQSLVKAHQRRSLGYHGHFTHALGTTAICKGSFKAFDNRGKFALIFTEAGLISLAARNVGLILD